MSFKNFEAAHRRLAILRLLADFQAHTTNETIIAEVLSSQGLSTSRDRLKTELAWLEEQDLIILQAPGGVSIATLTVRGLDVANGYTTIPGIARPEPGA